MQNHGFYGSLRMNARRAFTLVEMLVVIGIIAVLTAASVVGYSKVTASAEKAKCNELVKQVQTALVKIYNDNDGAWPRALVEGARANPPLLDAKAARPLASIMGLSVKNDQLAGYDRLGIVTPWAMQVIKSKGDNADESTPVPSGGTIKDHILRYSLDLEGNSIVKDAQVGGESIMARATALVWCAGRDGKEEAYSRGLRKDDIYSWPFGATQNVE